MKIFSLIANKYFENYKGLSKGSWIGILLILIESSAIGISFFLSIYFVNFLKINMFESGIIIACYSLGTVIGGNISGNLSDKFSPKNIATINLLSESLALLALTTITSIKFLMLDLLLLGIFTYGFMVSINLFILKRPQITSEIKLKSINISRVALNMGFGISGIIIGFTGYNFHRLFYLYSFILCLAALYLSFNFRKLDFKLSENLKTNDHGIFSSNCENKNLLILIFFCVFFVGIIISQLSITYPVYIKKLFPVLGMKAVSILFILDTFLIMLFQAPIVNITSQYNHTQIVGLGAFLMGLGMFILNFSFTFSLAILSCIIFSVGEMLFIAIAQLICYENSNENVKGKMMGIYQSVYAISKIVGPILGSYIYFSLGSAYVWYACALIGSLCFLSCIFFSNTNTSTNKCSISCK